MMAGYSAFESNEGWTGSLIWDQSQLAWVLACQFVKKQNGLGVLLPDAKAGQVRERCEGCSKLAEVGVNEGSTPITGRVTIREAY